MNLWLAAEEQSGLRIHWIRYGEVCTDVGAVIRRIVETLKPGYPALAAMQDVPTRAVTANFAVGDDRSWRTLLDVEAARPLWQAMHPRAVELLGLQP